MASGTKKVVTEPQEFNYRMVDGRKVCDIRKPGKGGEILATAVRPGTKIV